MADAALEAARLQWQFADAELIADTATSRVYKGTLADGTAAALKLLKPYGADEIEGVRLLQWLDGNGAARILGIQGLMILMEWLDGPPLGDMVRIDRDDDGATAILSGALRQLQRPRTNPPPLRSLREQFNALFATQPDEWPASHRPLVARAVDLATGLFSTTAAEIPLHGDFHHDNVVRGARGWQVIDPKGLIGDPHYEPANVFRNPYGAAEIARRPERIERTANALAADGRLDRRRLLAWATVHSAISACWDRGAGNAVDWDLTMMPLLFAALDRA